MFSAFINSFKIKELRTRILFTAGILILCRVAANIPCPGVDTANLDVYFTKLGEESATGQFLGMFDLFSGGALQHFAIGALGIMPYISASIIMQLLTPVVPSLEKLQREGEVGRGKINQYTRYLTIVICLVQGAMAAVAMTNPTRLGLPAPTLPLVSNAGVGFIIMSMIILTAGTMVLVWLGERITENGIGNGVSIIITANIIERLPQSLMALFEMMNSGFSASGTRFRPASLRHFCSSYRADGPVDTGTEACADSDGETYCRQQDERRYDLHALEGQFPRSYADHLCRRDPDFPACAFPDDPE